MAIGTAIELQDRMSGTLNRITAMLYTTTSAFQKVDNVSDQAFNPTLVSAMAQEVHGYMQRIEQLEADLVDANKRIEQMQKFTDKAADSAKMLKTAFSAVKGVIATLGLGKVIEASDGLVQTTSRLNLMTNSAEETQKLFETIYSSSQNARGSLSGMADVVARFGNNARDAFDSNEEVVAFANIVQKQMTIAGASTTEAQNAILQLSQGLGAGVLRGDELNSIFEQAPNLIQSIADYLEVPIGSIRKMAAEGKLTADIVKNALLNEENVKKVNDAFNEMPMTWAQVWQSMQNTALMKFQPVLQRINDFANTAGFQTLVNNVTSAMALLASVALNVLDTIAAIASFMTENWSIIAPIVMGVVAALALYSVVATITNTVNAISSAIAKKKAAADMMAGNATFFATAAQYGLNAALAACPITWIIAGIIAIIAVIALVCSWIAKSSETVDSGIGVIAGALSWLVGLVVNIFHGLLTFLTGIFVELYNLFAKFANFFGNFLSNPVAAIEHLFVDLFDTVLGVVESIAGLIDSILGTDWSSSVAGFRDRLQATADEMLGEQKIYVEELTQEEILANMPFDRWDLTDTFDKGAAWGDNVSAKMKGAFSFDKLLGGEGTDPYTDTDDMLAELLKGIESNTAETANNVDISNENLQYLRDSAEQEAINKFTTAEIKLDMTNNNNIASNMDIDGIVTQLSEGLREAMESAAEGVYA